MPVLRDIRQTKKINLKSVEGGEAEIYLEYLAGDLEKIAQRADSKPFLFTISLLIKSWNLQNEDETPLLINEENIGRLCQADLLEIQKNIDADSLKGLPSTDKKI